MVKGMQWVSRLSELKVLLVVMAVALAAVSLVVSHLLVSDLKKEEYNKMEVWAEAMQSVSNATDSTDITLELKVIEGNNTIPVIVLYSDGEVMEYRNVDDVPSDAEQLQQTLRSRALRMQNDGHCIRIDMPEEDYVEVCFDESLMLRRLALWPYVQLGIVLVFVAVAIFALLSSKRAEQNRVWVGLSKETAHQLGTPISSLMAWNEVLRETYPDDELLLEMGKDIQRLQRIADRFSKIGSTPEPKPEILSEVVDPALQYISRRASNRVHISSQLPEKPIILNMTAPLFEWVLENLCKNAIDAMDGQGSITVSAEVQADCVVIDVTDTGRGIPKNRFKTVFMPGYTTKARGWGLGLSLAKRIIEEYHNGRIYVKNSELGKGTTFRIEMKRQPSVLQS